MRGRQRERGGGECVHDVDPKRPNREESRGLLGRSDGRYEGNDYGGGVCRDLELEELGNGVVDAPALHDSLDDRSNIVTHEDDVGGLLGDLGTSDAHRKPYVGSLEGRTIVRTVSRDTNNLTVRAKGFNKNLLVFRGGPGQDLETGDNLGALLWVEGTENRTLHDDTSGGVDTTLSGDRSSGEDVVSGAHLDCDTRMVTGGDGFANTEAKWILDSSDGHKGQVAREMLVRDLVIRLEVGFGRGASSRSPGSRARLSSASDWRRK